jgi:hypothetical protein
MLMKCHLLYIRYYLPSVPEFKTERRENMHIPGGIHNFWDWCFHLYSSFSTMQWYVVVLAYLGSQCTKFHVLGGRGDFLCPFIWSCVSGLMQFCDGSDSDCASHFVQISEKVRQTLAVIRQAFGEESMSCTQVFAWHAWFKASQTSIEDDQAKSRACS